MKTHVFLIILLVALTAITTNCATKLPSKLTLTQEEIASADFGPYPLDYEQVIKNHMSKKLKDPYSAHYRFGKPRKGVAKDINERKHFGYIVPVAINAKNSYGAYIGEQLSYFIIVPLYQKDCIDVTIHIQEGYAKFVE